MLAVAMVTSLVANIVIAATDGRSRQPITVGGTFVVAAALVVQAGAPGPALLLVGGALLGVGTTWMVSGAEIAIANSVAERDGPAALPRRLARVNLLGTVGRLSRGPLLVAAARAAGVSWRVLFVRGRDRASPATATAAGGGRVPSAGPADRRRPRTRCRLSRQPSVWLLGLAAMVLIPLDESYLVDGARVRRARPGFSPTAAALARDRVRGRRAAQRHRAGRMGGRGQSTPRLLDRYQRSGASARHAPRRRCAPGWVARARSASRHSDAARRGVALGEHGHAARQPWTRGQDPAGGRSDGVLQSGGVRPARTWWRTARRRVGDGRLRRGAPRPRRRRRRLARVSRSRR